MSTATQEGQNKQDSFLWIFTQHANKETVLLAFPVCISINCSELKPGPIINMNASVGDVGK